MDPVELVGDRVLLRLPRLADAAEIERACQDAEIQRWVPVPRPYGPEHAREWVEGAPGSWAAEQELRFVVVERDGVERMEGRLVGAMGLGARHPGMREIGFWTAPWARRQGRTADAARTVCRWGFQTLGLHRIEWLAKVGNHGSRAVAERVGFRFEGTLRAGMDFRGAPADAWVAGLLPTDLLAPTDLP
jgi:RimJ/RimL family protein N-acetyltransferase